MKRREQIKTPRARELVNRRRARRNVFRFCPKNGKPEVPDTVEADVCLRTAAEIEAARLARKRPALPPLGRPLTALAQYDAACRALAEARSFTEIRAIADEMEHVKLYGRQVKDRALIAAATEVQTRAERRLGELLLQAECMGWIGRGRPKKADAENVTGSGHFTLDEAGIDRNLSSRAQKLAELPAEQFEAGIASVRERIASGEASLVNGARAIMASRQEPDDSLDYFPTPPWATRALIECVLPQVGYAPGLSRAAWEPACGEGHIAEVLREYFADVTATDIQDYGYNDFQVDFLTCEQFSRRDKDADWIITNPPFGDKAEAFVLKALELATIGVAMFVRLQWLETTGRYEAVFRDHPPTLIAFFAERVNLCKGRWDPDGTTATAYIWLTWVKGRLPQAPFWVPPGQREALTRAADRERFTAHPVVRNARKKEAAP